MCQTEAAQDAPDRDAVDREIVTICQFQHQIIQCQVRLCHHPRFDLAPKAGQLAMTAAIALCARLQTTCFTLQDHHVVDELHRNPEPRRRRTVGMPFFHKSDSALAKSHRMWSAHIIPPYLLRKQGITDQVPWES